MKSYFSEMLEWEERARRAERLLNEDLTPKEVENVLKFNGVMIDDSSGTQISFARIDAYEAATAKGVISTTVGAEPFYTVSTNPTTADCLASLSEEETEIAAGRFNKDFQPEKKDVLKYNRLRELENLGVLEDILKDYKKTIAQLDQYTEGEVLEFYNKYVDMKYIKSRKYSQTKLDYQLIEINLKQELMELENENNFNKK